MTSKEKRIGFRTVKLVQSPIKGSEGLSFYFKINGIPIFFKGSNWIPADAFRDRVKNETITRLLLAAVYANMNVIRVWGGGGYETGFFYEECDRLGLMIWHDFMFACAMYPTNPAFLMSVTKEVMHQVSRLQHHPSVILWSANNENEVALRENWYGTDINFHQYKKDYIELYVDTIKSLVSKIDPFRPFIVSSPSNGVESEKEGWIAKEPRSPLYGDVHVYNYQENCWNVSAFPRPRFASEYGYQSYPSFDALKNVSLRGDLSWNSTLMYYRQHHPNGNKQLENLIKQNFKLPHFTDEVTFFRRMIYMSQIVQALCTTFETEHYRRLRGRLVSDEANFSHNFATGKSGSKNVDGKNAAVLSERLKDTLYGDTMGAMYWQLNDIWQAPSWASIEYGGKWKMLHYYAKDFFRDIALSYYKHDNEIKIYVISDLLIVMNSAVLNISSRKWSSFGILKEFSFPLIIKPQSVQHVFTLNIIDWCGEDMQCFFILHLSSIAAATYSRPVFPISFSKVKDLGNPEIMVSKQSIVTLTQMSVNFTLTAQQPAAFVWLSAKAPGHFSDNGFTMYENAKWVVFTGYQPIDIETFFKRLTVSSLYDVYV